jgi:sulfite reductase (NADPH) flavoprotein alpha-component
MPARNATQVEATYLRANPEHERARNRLYLDAATGEATQHERYADKPLAGRLVNSIYPLHMGTYWGMPGRIVMALSSLGPGAVRDHRMDALSRTPPHEAGRAQRARTAEPRRLQPAVRGAEPVLLTFATQTGHAERIALQTAAVLQSAGVAVVLQPLVRLSVDALQRYRKVLLVASTFGDGDPPDSLRAFARQFARQSDSGLQHVHYGLLALGDRHYANFCGFGRTLDHDLRGHGAQALFPMIEVSNGDAGALARWRQSLAEGIRRAGRCTWQTHQPQAAALRVVAPRAPHLAQRRAARAIRSSRSNWPAPIQPPGCQAHSSNCCRARPASSVELFLRDSRARRTNARAFRWP